MNARSPCVWHVAVMFAKAYRHAGKRAQPASEKKSNLEPRSSSCSRSPASSPANSPERPAGRPTASCPAGCPSGRSLGTLRNTKGYARDVVVVRSLSGALFS